MLAERSTCTLRKQEGETEETAIKSFEVVARKRAAVGKHERTRAHRGKQGEGGHYKRGH